jgi:hypothetical protein
MKAKSIRRFKTFGPGECANNVSDCRDGEDKQEAGAQPADAGHDFRESGFPYEVEKEQQAQEREKNTEWRQFFAPALWLFWIVFQVISAFSSRNQKRNPTLSQRRRIPASIRPNGLCAALLCENFASFAVDHWNCKDRREKRKVAQENRAELKMSQANIVSN